MNDAGDGDFHLLAIERARDVGYLQYLCRYVPRSAVGADGDRDPLPEPCVKQAPLGQDHEQQHPHVTVPLLSDHQRVRYFLQVLHLAVNLRGTYAHAARIQGGVGAAVDDYTAVRGDLDIVTVVPHPWEGTKVGVQVFLVPRVAPKIHRHRGERGDAYQFGFLADHGLSLFVPGLHVHAQANFLYLPGVHGIDGRTEHEAGNDIRSAADGSQVHVPPDRIVDPLEALFGER